MPYKFNPIAGQLDYYESGLPTGGNAGQLLAKKTTTDYDVQWADAGSTSGGVPIGGIILWSGSIATIPPTCELCDGTNGTPDLRDKFVVGATQDDSGVAKTNILGTLSQTGGATGHSHSGHAALSHSGAAVGDHTGFTHDVAIANHPDLTHAAIASHPALTLNGLAHDAVTIPAYTHPVLTIEGATHNKLTMPGLTHSVLTIEGQTHAGIAMASRNDLVAASHSHAATTLTASHATTAYSKGATASNILGGITGTAALSGVSFTTNSVTLPATTYTPSSHPTFTASAPVSHGTYTADGPASHPTFTASAPANHASLTVAVGSHPTVTASGMTHDAAAAHGTAYGVHSITAPAAHGSAGTVTHSFTESSAHSVSSHDTVSQVPSFYALAYIQRMS